MLMEDLPLDNAALKETIGNGKVEFCLHNPRSKSSMQTWELKVLNSDGTRKIVIVRDYGFEVYQDKARSGNRINITKVELNGKDKVVLTCDKPLEGDVLIMYAGSGS